MKHCAYCVLPISKRGQTRVTVSNTDSRGQRRTYHWHSECTVYDRALFSEAVAAPRMPDRVIETIQSRNDERENG